MTPEIQRKPPLRCCAKCAGWYSARPLCLGIDWSLIPSAQVGGYQPPNRRSQHSKQGHFLRGNAMHLSACLWMWEVLRVGPKSHHTFSIWALKMHLVSCRCIIWSLILPFIRVGFVLFSHCFKVGSPPTLRDEAVEGSGLCCTLLLNTWWLLAQPWPYLTY